MLLSKLIGQRTKENPKDSQSISHNFLSRGGYIKAVSSGIYSLLPLAQIISKKIEAIIRDEMTKVSGQEILMPVVLPAELWKESGRYEIVDESLLRFNDRNNKAMVLAMTHEEAICHIVRTEITSYKQLPSMLYQIQTKYRDEARPRAGLIRVREFTMKDAYSFHINQECLSEYYQQCLSAYNNIFNRIGLKEFLVIESDSGMMGGSVAHEFMAISSIGEDSIICSGDRSYIANKEVAVCQLSHKKDLELDLELVHTPEKTSIEEVSSLLSVEQSQTAKAVFFQSDEFGGLIFALIRGDRQVNEIKLKNHLKITSLYPAEEEYVASVGIVVGYASPLGGLKSEEIVFVIDFSVVESNNLVVGANKKDYHYKNFNYQRDMQYPADIVDINTVVEGDICLKTQEPLQELRGIEIGNIFQLGTKYSKAMSCRYLDKNGKEQIPLMGCYGIGVGRNLASVIEQSHDDYGPIWPLSIAPFHLHIIALNYSKSSVKSIADEAYVFFQSQGIEVIFDNRNVKAGFAFNDADLLGVPYRIVISPKTIEDQECEFLSRDKSFKKRVSLNELKKIIEFIKEQLSLL